MQENGKEMTAEEIVAGLRSDDQKTRTRSLDALFPKGGGAILMRTELEYLHSTVTTQVDAGRCFLALLHLAQQFGTFLGIKLDWVPQADDPSKIQIAGAMPGPPLRPLR